MIKSTTSILDQLSIKYISTTDKGSAIEPSNLTRAYKIKSITNNLLENT